MPDFFSTPDETGEIRQSDLHASMGESLGAQAADAIDPQDSLSGMYLFRRLREANAGGTDLAVGAGGDIDAFSTQPLEERQAVLDAQRNAIPDTSIEDAKKRVKEEGLEGTFKLPDQPSIKTPVLDLMIQEAHDRRDREAAIERGPHGFLPGALGTVTSIGVGMLDPVNAAAFSIPVLGEARLGKIIASAGDSLMTRGAAKFGIGAAQGAVGTAVLQPADWWLHTQDGEDYTFAQALQSVVMGAGMGGAFHAGFGGVGDAFRRFKGKPLAGSPEDLLQRGLMTGTHIHADQLADDGVPVGELPGMEDVPGISQPPPHPAAAILADLPPAAREDAVHVAMADVISGRPTQAAEMLNIAADHDPRIAESFEAWHGSPHDFDRFDASQIGTGEGAQVYGHGLYLAENPEVAGAYQRKLGRDPDAFRIDGRMVEYPSPEYAAAAVMHRLDVGAAEAARNLGDYAPTADVKAVLEKWATENPQITPGRGNIYRVRVSANHEHLLDWDKPLHEQSEHVRDALRGLGVSEHQSLVRLDATGESARSEPETGAGALHVISRQHGHGAATSRALSEAGIPGIKYLDARSRTAGNGSRNFVVFDDKHIEITHKNGEAVHQAELPPRLHALSAEARNWPEPPPGARIAGNGDHGPELAGLEGRWNEAVDWLSHAQSGDARGVLEHPEVPGRIDVIWGNKAGGLEHIMALHPEMIPDLPERLARMRLVQVVQKGMPGERLVLSSADRSEQAIIRTSYDNGKKTWLLTAYSLESDRSGRGGDTTGSPSESGPAQSPVPPEGKVAPDSPAGNGEKPSGDRGHDLTAAATDPRWRELADVKHDYDEPEVLEESRAADREPEPASTESPERSLTALETAAADAEAVWRRIEPTLTEKERAMVNDVLDQLKLDREARDKIITDGVACLAGAIA